MDLKTDIKRMLTLGSIEQTLRDLKRYSDVLSEGRQEYFDKVIDVYEGTKNPKECFALAYAYMYKGAKYRPNAIKYFERYLLNPVKIEGYRGIYLDLGKLYEAEYDFTNAEKYYKMYTERHKDITVGYTFLANLYTKIDIDKAIDFVSGVLVSEYAQDPMFNHCIQVKYDELLKKKADGYVYKPRKDEAVYNPVLEEVKAEIKEDKTDTLSQKRKKVVKVVAVFFILYVAVKCSQGGDEDNYVLEVETTEVTESTTDTERFSETVSLSQQERLQQKLEDINNSVDGIKKSSDEIWNDPDVKRSRENLKATFKEVVFDYDAFKELMSNDE